MTGRLDVAASVRTDTGRRRAANEDAALCAHPVYLVADGMGGHDRGAAASAAAVAAFRPLVGRDDVTAADVRRALEVAHRDVAAIAASAPRGAGTTLTGVIAVRADGEPAWLVLNVGDSRVYRLWDGGLERLTIDHSLAAERIAAGTLDPARVEEFEGRNVITRAVGDASGTPDVWFRPVVTGERMLVCSDGLTREVDDGAIRHALAHVGTADATTTELVARALEAGGRDNVTAIVLDVRAGGVCPRAEEFTGVSASSEATRAADTLVSARRGGRGDGGPRG